MRTRLAIIASLACGLGLTTAGPAEANLLAPKTRCAGQTELSATVDKQEPLCTA
jgi:hypothetical protein